jgi:hypothetical protein
MLLGCISFLSAVFCFEKYTKSGRLFFKSAENAFNATIVSEMS